MAKKKLWWFKSKSTTVFYGTDKLNFIFSYLLRRNWWKTSIGAEAVLQWDGHLVPQSCACACVCSGSAILCSLVLRCASSGEYCPNFLIIQTSQSSHPIPLLDPLSAAAVSSFLPFIFWKYVSKPKIRPPTMSKINQSRVGGSRPHSLYWGFHYCSSLGKSPKNKKWKSLGFD